MDPFSVGDPIAYAEFMKVQGNRDFKNGNYSIAIKKYDEAIRVMEYIGQMGGLYNNREMAVLLCNRSNAFYNLDKWNEAYYSAQEGLQWDPSYVKGYYRIGYSLIQLSRPLDAARVFCQGLSYLCGSSDVGQVSDFIVGVFSSVNNVRTITPNILSICKKIVREDFSPLVWQQVIEKLVRKGLWQSCLLLAVEKDQLPRNLRVAALSLKDLFEKYVLQGQYERMERVPKLVEWLISIGASVESVGPHPLHAVIMLCIRAKGNHLFRWLLEHKPELKDLINQQNEDGATVLHIVASQCNEYSLKNQIEDVLMLLSAGVNPMICDKQSKSAMDILKRNKKFKVLDIINKHIARHMPYTKESAAGGSEATADVTALLQNAFDQFVQFYLENADRKINLLKQEEVQNLLKLLSGIKEIPREIAGEVPPALASRFIKLLLKKQRWHEVVLLLSRRASGKSFLKKCNLSDLDIDTVLDHVDRSDKRVRLMKCLLERGVSPEGSGVSGEKPLQRCLKSNDFELAYLFLTSGADPHFVSIMEGDTPLHAALYIYFDKNDCIGFQFLQFLLELYDSDPSAFPYLNPNSQDRHGNTVLHIIFQKNPTKQIKKMLGLLARFDINLNLKNNQGRDVCHKKKKNDPMRIAWNEAVAEARKKCRHDGVGHQAKTTPASSGSESKNSVHSSTAHVSKTQPAKLSQDKETDVGAASQKQAVTEDAPVKNSALADASKPLTLRECLVHEILQLIQKLALCDVSAKVDSATPEAVKPCRSVAEGENSGDGQASGQTVPVCNGGQDSGLAQDDPVEGSHEELDKVKLEEEEEACPEEDEPFHDIKAQMQDFDKMTWEIECTSEMLKKLASKHMPPYMKNKVIFAIQQLGNGEWTQSLQKRLEHLKSDIQLYEAKLSKGARMLWEVAIDFSPRCSDSAETIMENEHSTHPAEKTGRVYTEIIRIWDIELDHNKLNRAIEAICTAYNRGRACILRKKLKGVGTVPISSNVKTQKRFPRIYVEDTKASDKPKDSVVPEYFPPASAVETEYNIMKFHSFSTNMALNIINDMTSAVEYPFRVGELEYAVIDLNPKPLEPLILIGRSGTGKTTCCLYRLWKKFHSYWVRAELAEGPLLFRQVWHRLKFSMHSEEEGSKEEDPDEKQYGGDPVDAVELEASVSTDNEQEADEDDQHSSALDDSDVNSVCDWEEAEEHAAEAPDKLQHLHQIFVTKNHVLCQEVQRNFVELSKSSKVTSHFKPLEGNVYRLQDVADENFPLFLTSKQLLLLLDASLPDPFFLRNEDGSLKHTIGGWSTKDDATISNWQEDEEEIEVDYDEDEKVSEVQMRESDPRVFVTYNVFAKQIWPKMVKGRHWSGKKYNSALVWKEIKSFLKGSFEAMNSPQGILSEEEYKKLGRKRSPNFKEDRGEIYQLFCHYQQIKCQGNYFDEEDFLHKLFQRLSEFSVLPWCVHELYGDEIQDFTQAELALLMKCIDDPNAMFLTGDTAQSIMEGVAFRFSDLRSLFHYASKSSNEKKQCTVRKPKRIYQLYQNYRSHSGILYLASGVVDLLQYYFPESFDRLPRDRGLFDGPKPTVLESCSVSDLAILLRGNKRRTQPIEFGAHQVILVANETAKEKIPEELSLALVLTIYEAKGLEFDDVLLYNFFTDSEAYKEWKIISSFPHCYSLFEETGLILETSWEKDAEAEKKSLLPNPEMYKLLNGELKQLYTAITRARVNLWIFDENSDRRDPAFQYFIKREFVQVVKTDEDKDLDDTMFVKTSTPEEWVAQGEYYAKHQCWKVAAKCYQKGGATEKEKLALAHDAVLNVQSKKISPKEKQMEYMDLAKTYLECGEPNLALKCLFHAKEYSLSAQLCEKLGKVKEAAYFYKRGQCYKDAYRCFEQVQDFDLAIKMCCQEELYEEAAKSVERYERMLRQEKKSSAKLSYSANPFYLEAAAKYLRANRTGDMMAMLSHLGTEDQLVFLKTHKQFSEAADLLKKDGRGEEAAKLMKQHGFVLEAAKLTSQPDFRASCLLAAARRSVVGSCKLENLTGVLSETLELCERMNQRAGRAEATYLMGMLEKDFHLLEKAFHMFLDVNHNAGAVEALFQAARCEGPNEALLRLASLGLEALLNLVKAFHKADTNAQREMVKSCFEYFGIVPVEKNSCQVTQNEAGCVLEGFSELLSLREKKTSDQLLVNLEDVKTLLNKHLLKRLTAVARCLFERRLPGVCTKFIAGLKCEDSACEDFHRVLLYHELKSVFHCKIYLAAINGLLLEARRIWPKYLFHDASTIDELLTADKYVSCRSLISAIFPKHFHLRMISESPLACKNILSLHGGSRTAFPGGMVLREYIRAEFKNETARNRRESTDLWLKTMQVLAFISSYPEEFERLVDREEDDYHRELKLAEERTRGRCKGVEGKYGMLMPDKSGSANSIHVCFIRLLQGSIDQLYVHRNPEQCKRLFFRFMNVLVKKCVDPLVPSIGNTVTLLEFQFLVSCAVLLRLSKTMTLCLPKSYIALFHYWDFLFTKGARHRAIFSIVQDYKPDNTKQAIQDFKRHVRYLADVLGGYENFNVLLDAFEDLDCITSGEAERTVVLCLVMLLNADQLLRWKHKEFLLEHFPSLKEKLIKMKEEYPSRVPERLLKIVDLVSRATDMKEVVAGLKDLLYCRDEEFLADCSWRWDHRGARGTRFESSKEIRGIYFKITDLNRFSYPAQEEYFDEPEAELEPDMYVEEREDPLANIAAVRQQKQQQKAFAKRKLRGLFLFVFCCVRWKRMASSRPEPLEMASGVFKKADIDTTQCDLCGVKFLPSSSRFVPQAEPSEKEPSEATTPTEADWEGAVERNENFVSGETFESHITRDEHGNKFAAYQKYLDYFRNKVEPLINDGTNVLEKIADTTRIRGHLTAKEEAKLVRIKIEEDIKSISDMVEDLYKRKAWADAEEAMSKSADRLKSNVDSAVSWLEKAENSHLREEEDDLDKDLGSEVKDEDRTFEELYDKKPSRKKGKKGKSKRK